MEILRSIGSWIVRMIVINVGLILFFGSAPLLYFTVPFWFLAKHNLADIAGMATIYMIAGPFVCAFWMTVVCHWHTVKKARLAGVED
jgi:hypothetical protein